MIHFLLSHGKALWDWLRGNGGVNATALLVIVTIWYAVLTARMARAMARQTKTLVQPVASLSVRWEGEPFAPRGYFEIKNLGTQPMILLDVKLNCSFSHPVQVSDPWRFTDHQTLWDENIVPPGETLRPSFSFERELDETGKAWIPAALGYGLRVVASDLSRQVVLTYDLIPVLSVATCREGMPLEVRLRYFRKRCRSLYFRIRYWANNRRIRRRLGKRR